MSNSYGLATSKSSSGFRPWWLLAFAVFLALLGSCLATQYIAYKTGYHRALGSYLQFGDLRFYLPWRFIQWQRLISPLLFENALRLGILCFAVPQIALLARLIKRVSLKGIDDLHGSARWAKLEEVKAMGLLAGEGVYVGGFWEKATGLLHYLRHNGPEHILAFAPTRSGKGVGLIIPTLLSWSGSVFCLDIKGENWALTAGFRKNELGHKVFRLDPADHTGKGARFNPLQEIRLNSFKAIPDVQNIATSLVDPNGKGLEDYWAKAGFSFMAGALMHVCVKVLYEQKRHANLSDFCLALANEESEIDAFYDEMLETDHAAWIAELFPDMPEQHGRDIHIFAASAGREMKNKADNERSGVVGTVQSNLGLYRDPVVRKNIETSDFTIDDLMNHDVPVALYLVTPPSDIARFTPLNRLIISLIVSRRTEKMDFKDGRSIAGYKHRLLMLLDEFTAPGKIQVIEKAIAFCAGYGIKLYLIVQDLVQLNEAYGKNSGIMGNSHVRIAYAANNPDTAKLLSELAGKTTIIQSKTSISGHGSKKNASKSVQETARPLLTPDECARIPGINTNAQGAAVHGDMLIFIAGQFPIYGKQLLYFKDPVFLSRAKMPAPERSDSLYFNRELEEPEASSPKSSGTNEAVAAAEAPGQKASIPPSKQFSDFLEEQPQGV